MFERGVMDMLLLPDYIMDTPGILDTVETTWTETIPLGKRKQWVQEEPPAAAKMSKPSNGDQNSWEQVEELAADLDGSCSLSSLNVDLGSTAFQTSDALLSLPSLTVLKQEIFSPFNSNEASGETNGGGGGGGGHTSPHRHKHMYHCYDQGMNGSVEYKVGLNSPGQSDGSNSGSNLIVTTAPATSTVPHHSEDCRFQYVLAAATSIATKVNEETLTYLNQGQSYEIKLKKLGDLSEYRGKILKSVVRLVFHERRLQYMEREQLAAWEASHPGDSILEVDLPLSYGLFQLSQDPSHLNTIEFLWDPTKEVGVYIKVNCISTEFTPKKHGGEKGVPFRIQVETYLQCDHAVRHLHTASCQVKVFKLKGADRKHKQDREKIYKRPPVEQEKYQCSYDCTILSDVPINGDNAFPPLLLNNANSPPVTTSDVAKLRPILPVVKKEEASPQPSLNSTCEASLQKLGNNVSHGCGGGVGESVVNANWSPAETSAWLQNNRYATHVPTLASYSGADLLRLSRDNLVQLCGLPDGIRLYNALHARTIAPRLTVYMCSGSGQKVYQAIFLSVLTSCELAAKLAALLDISTINISGLYMEGPNGIRVVVSDELVSHIADQSTFTVEITARDTANSRYQLLLKQTTHLQPPS